MKYPGKNMDALQFRAARLDDLSSREWHDLLQLRQQVFIIEQQCIYADLDGVDLQAIHLAGWRDGQPQAYLRLVDPGIKFAEPSLGRVVSASACRGQGLGRQLVAAGLQLHQQHYPGLANRISAQHYLLDFYASFGYQPLGEVYEEDGIPHQEMLWHP